MQNAARNSSTGKRHLHQFQISASKALESVTGRTLELDILWGVRARGYRPMFARRAKIASPNGRKESFWNKFSIWRNLLEVCQQAPEDCAVFWLRWLALLIALRCIHYLLTVSMSQCRSIFAIQICKTTLMSPPKRSDVHRCLLNDKRPRARVQIEHLGFSGRSLTSTTSVAT